MARASEVVKQAVADLSNRLKEIKQADEEDLGKVAAAFDGVAQRADEVASLLSGANDALQGKGEQKPKDSKDSKDLKDEAGDEDEQAGSGD